MATDASDSWIELHAALGLVVTAGAKMEDILRVCFCMLDGGENADVVAAGQDVRWLIDYCGDLAEANPQIDQPDKCDIRYTLDRCRAATQARNELIHGVHNWPATSKDQIPLGWGWVERSRRHKPVLVKEWTVNNIHDVWIELREAADALEYRVSKAVGPGRAVWARRAPKMVDTYGRPWPF